MSFEKIIRIKTINDLPSDFSTLFRYFSEAINSPYPVRLDFINCKFIKHNGSAFLGALRRYLELNRKYVSPNFGLIDHEVKEVLIENGYLGGDNYGQKKKPRSSVVYYRELDENISMDSLKGYINKKLFSNNRKIISRNNRDKLADTIWGIYRLGCNSDNLIKGAFMCGQHYPNLGILGFCTLAYNIDNVQGIENLFEDLKIEKLNVFLKSLNDRIDLYWGEEYISLENQLESVYKTTGNSNYYFPGIILNISTACSSRSPGYPFKRNYF